MKAIKVKSKKMLTVIIAIIAIILCLGLKMIYNSWSHESTDDASIDGNIIPLRTSVTGYIEKVRFHDNQKVTKGDTLIIFDTVALKSQITQAEAQVISAQTELEACKKQIAASGYGEITAGFNAGSAKENVAQANVKVWQAQKDFQRIDKMYKSGAATQQTYDDVKATWQMAKAQEMSLGKQFEAMKTQKSSTHLQTNIHYTQLKQAVAHIKQAEAQLTQARDMYKHAFVTAPCNGIISKKDIEVGQFVPSGTALASLINTADLWITANFKETQLDDMKVGESADIKIDAYPGLTLTGRIESFCAATNSKFSLLPAESTTGNFIKITQRIPVRIRLSHSQHKEMLFPGMSAFVSVKTK